MATEAKQIKALESDIADIKALVGELAENGSKSSAASNVVNKVDIKKLAKELGSNVSHFADHKKEQFIGAKKDCEKAIQRRPFTTTAVALAAGVLVGSLLRKRN